METVKNALSRIISIFDNFHMGISDVLDILIAAFIIYKVMEFISKTKSARIARGIIVLIILVWLSDKFQLNVLYWVFNKTINIGILALVVLFQPEIRRLLEQFGKNKLTAVLFSKEVESNNTENAIRQTIIACEEMSRGKVGVLIIFEREISLDDMIKTGTTINADVNSELLKNIFFNKAPLHDGAAIVRDGRIVAAGCMVPLSSNANLSRDLGMRHRAGIGASEQSDAVSVMVSEETGSVSVAVDGMLKRHLAMATFEKLLRNELLPPTDETSSSKNPFTRIRGRRNVK